MEMKDYLTNYYERYDEEGRLISKHGMVEYITTMDFTSFPIAIRCFSSFVFALMRWRGNHRHK